MTLMDANATFYPLNDLPGTGLLKEPRWKNLFPIKCFSQCLHPAKETATSSKHAPRLNYVSVFAMRVEQLITSIYRSDLASVQDILQQCEAEITLTNGSHKLKQVLSERTDGNRNLVHAAVFACAPTSNTATAPTADIYASYGSNSSSGCPAKIERPWSTSAHQKTAPLTQTPAGDQQIIRKISISLESIQLPATGKTTESPKTSDTSSFWPAETRLG